MPKHVAHDPKTGRMTKKPTTKKPTKKKPAKKKGGY